MEVPATWNMQFWIMHISKLKKKFLSMADDNFHKQQGMVFHDYEPSNGRPRQGDPASTASDFYNLKKIK